MPSRPSCKFQWLFVSMGILLSHIFKQVLAPSEQFMHKGPSIQSQPVSVHSELHKLHMHHVHLLPGRFSVDNLPSLCD
jgi:hypothetical protein